MRWLALLIIYTVSLTRLLLASRWSELILSGCVLGVLAIFFVVGLPLRQSPTGKDILVRTETWCWMIGIFLLATALHPGVVFVLLAFLSFVALREYFSLLPMYHRGTFLRAEDRPAIALAYLTIPATYWLGYDQWYLFYIVLIPVFATLCLPILLVATNNPQGILVSMGSILAGMVLFVFLFSHAAILIWFSPIFLFYALLVTEMRDVLAYCFGKALSPLKWSWLHVAVAPKINPRKTWVGSALASFGCAGISAAMAPLMPELPAGRPSAQYLFWLGFGVGWLGLAGDLATGAIKRDLQVKDTGHALPGHGGVIDRINGVIFTVPVIFHLTWHIYSPGMVEL